MPCKTIKYVLPWSGVKTAGEAAAAMGLAAVIVRVLPAIGRFGFSLIDDYS
jgi:hypothetical protein